MSSAETTTRFKPEGARKDVAVDDMGLGGPGLGGERTKREAAGTDITGNRCAVAGAHNHAATSARHANNATCRERLATSKNINHVSSVTKRNGTRGQISIIDKNQGVSRSRIEREIEDAGPICANDGIVYVELEREILGAGIILTEPMPP